MSAFTEPCAQVREALESQLHKGRPEWQKILSPEPVAALAALDRVERLATTYETALQQIEAISPWADASGHRVRQIARAVLSAREEGAA